MTKTADPRLPEVGSYRIKEPIEGRSFKVDSSLPQDQQQIIIHINSLLEELKQRLFKKRGEHDVTNTLARNEFVEKFTKLFKENKNEVLREIDIDSLVDDALDDGDIRLEFAKEIKTVLLDAIRNIGEIKTNKENKENKEGDKENGLKLQIDDKTAELTIQRIQQGGHLKDLENQMQQLSIANTNAIVDEYKRMVGIYGKNNENRGNPNGGIGFSLFSRRRRRIILDSDSRIQAQKTVDKLYGMIKFGLVMNIFRSVGHALGSVLKYTFSIFKHINNMVSTVISGVSSLVSKVAITAFNTVISGVSSLVSKVAITAFNAALLAVSIPLKLVFGATKMLTKMTGLVAKNLFSALKFMSRGIGYFLITPVGMYTLGFVLGYLWERINKKIGPIALDKKTADELKKKAEEKLKSMYDRITDSIEKKYEELFGRFDTYMHAKFPTIWGYGHLIAKFVKDKVDNVLLPKLKSGIKAVNEFFKDPKSLKVKIKNVVKVGIAKTKGIVEQINTLSLQMLGKKPMDAIKSLYNFFKDNWQHIAWITTAMTGLYVALIEGGPLLNLLKYCPIKGLGLFQSIGVAAMFFGGQFLGDAVFEAFTGIDDANLKFANEEMKELNEEYGDFSFNLSDRMAMIKDNETRGNLKNVYERLKNEFQEASIIMNTINGYRNDKELMKSDEKATNIIRPLIDFAYKSPYMTGNKDEFKKTKTMEDHLEYLNRNMTTRISRLADIVALLNRESGDDLKETLKILNKKGIEGYEHEDYVTDGGFQIGDYQTETPQLVNNGLREKLKGRKIKKTGIPSRKEGQEKTVEFGQNFGWMTAREISKTRNTGDDYQGYSITQLKHDTLSILKQSKYKFFGQVSGTRERDIWLERIAFNLKAEDRKSIQEFLEKKDEKGLMKKLEELKEQLMIITKKKEDEVKRKQEELDRQKSEAENNHDQFERSKEEFISHYEQHYKDNGIKDVKCPDLGKYLKMNEFKHKFKEMYPKKDNEKDR